MTGNPNEIQRTLIYRSGWDRPVIARYCRAMQGYHVTFRRWRRFVPQRGTIDFEFAMALRNLPIG